MLARSTSLLAFSLLSAPLSAQLSVSALATGGFGEPADGGTPFLNVHPFSSAGETVCLTTTGIIDCGAMTLFTDANGEDADRALIEGPFPEGYTPIEEALLDGGLPYSSLPPTVPNVGALIGAFVPQAVESNPSFQPMDEDLVAVGITGVRRSPRA